MKKLTLMGIGMIALALIFLYSSSVQFENNIANSTLHSGILTPHNTLIIKSMITNSTILGTFYYSNSSNISYYLVDSRVFSNISRYLNSTALLNRTSAYEGSGVYEIIYHNSSGVFPEQSTYTFKPPNYYYNGTAIFGNGTYYNIFQDTGNTSVIFYYSIIQKLQLSANNAIIESSVFGLVAVIMLFAGIGVIGYSVMIKKEDKPKQEAESQKIDELYAKYDAKKPSGAARRRKKGK